MSNSKMLMRSKKKYAINIGQIHPTRTHNTSTNNRYKSTNVRHYICLLPGRILQNVSVFC